MKFRSPALRSVPQLSALLLTAGLALSSGARASSTPAAAAAGETATAPMPATNPAVTAPRPHTTDVLIFNGPGTAGADADSVARILQERGATKQQADGAGLEVFRREMGHDRLLRQLFKNITA